MTFAKTRLYTRIILTKCLDARCIFLFANSPLEYSLLHIYNPSRIGRILQVAAVDLSGVLLRHDADRTGLEPGRCVTLQDTCHTLQLYK